MTETFHCKCDHEFSLEGHPEKVVCPKCGATFRLFYFDEYDAYYDEVVNT